MMAALDAAGWRAAPADEADLIIINTCGFIEAAKRESINTALLWRKKYPNKKIMMTGCLARRYGAELREALSEVDCIFENADPGDGTADIAAAAAGALGAAAPGPAPRAPCEPGARPLLSSPGLAYLKVSEGCNNACSFCAIPLIRGPLRSRPIESIVTEAEALVTRRGVRELCLIGQDLAAYGMDRGGQALPALLEALSRLQAAPPCDFRVRLLYLHPDHFPEAILPIMARDSRFYPYFDIPFQHAAPAVLAAMRRTGSAASYLALLERIRARLPDAVIRSTFMTGFPGETDAAFDALLRFQQEARLDWMGCFCYSREEGTAAFSLPGRVSKKLAAERKAILEERQVPITERAMDRFVGREAEALVEEPFVMRDDDESPLALGRMFCQAPEVDGATVIKSPRPLAPGALARGRVSGRRGFDLELVTSP
jgi:ribosomal protein S12 methylthiotransferase